MERFDHPADDRTVSRVRGRYQRPALGWLSYLVAAFALAALVLPDSFDVGAGVAAVSILVTVPLVRVGWLCVRWTQERDYRFVALGLALLVVVAASTGLALR